MNTEITNDKEVQLELPFSKSTYKNNINNLIASEVILNNNTEDISHLDPFLPSKDWDKRPQKKFFIEIWITSDSFDIIEVYATSEKVARNFLDQNFCISGLFAVPDFPTLELNQVIADRYKYIKDFNGECYDL
tara:strand:+ start:1959 stop:2357 length:399 start_codon:yes stop_codon:yes gene_type:complete